MASTWVDRAVCGDGWPTDLWIVTQRGRAHPGAQQLCAECSVDAECLADGWWDDDSVRGRLTPKQRGALRSYLAARRPVAGAADESGAGLLAVSA